MFDLLSNQDAEDIRLSTFTICKKLAPILFFIKKIYRILEIENRFPINSYIITIQKK